MTGTLVKQRVLVAEDESLVMMMLEDALVDAGCEPLVASDLETALALAQAEPLDCAYLDINLGGDEVYPVAEIPVQRKIPFVIASGYTRDTLPADYRETPLLAKPFTTAELLSAITTVIGSDDARQA